jgi:hypothetical protein
MGGSGDQIYVHGIEHQLDGHDDKDGGPAR